MAVRHMFLPEYLDGFLGVPACFFPLAQLHAGAGQVGIGHRHLVGDAPPRHDGQGLQKLLLCGGIISHLLVEQRDIVP